MISAKVDFLQLLVVKATVGRLAVGEVISLAYISLLMHQLVVEVMVCVLAAHA